MASGAVEDLVVIVLPAKININVCGCLCWGQCCIFFNLFFVMGHIMLLYQTINHKNRHARKTREGGLLIKST